MTAGDAGAAAVGKRCDDDLHERTLIDGMFVCRDCDGFPEQPPVIAPRPTDECDHGPTARLLDEAWCVTCQHTHIATIPVTTFRCAGDEMGGCGFGCWGSTVAAAHATSLPNHVVYPVLHQMVPLAPAEAAKHRDALADTGDAYHAFHGWVLNCLWCEYESVGKSKAEALRGMQRHYDAVLPEGATIHG